MAGRKKIKVNQNNSIISKKVRMSFTEAMEELGVSYQTIFNMVKDGRLETEKIGKRKRVFVLRK